MDVRDKTCEELLAGSASGLSPADPVAVLRAQMDAHVSGEVSACAISLDAAQQPLRWLAELAVGVLSERTP